MAGARPRTLPAAIVPVAVGAGCAVGAGIDGAEPVWWRVVLAAVVSLALQIGVNYANDYSDGVRGTDDVRVGPVRLVATGLATPSQVKRAALLSFGVAAVAGLVLAADTTWWLLVVGAVSIAAGWLYTGGPKPYGYLGLGEVFVFVFFGLVATAGTVFVAVEQITALSLVAGSIVGCLACALLVINNLRDIPTDRAAGKVTLAVRLGEGRTRALFGALLAGAYLSLVPMGRATDTLWVMAPVGSIPLAMQAIAAVRRASTPRELIPVLQATSLAQGAYALLLVLALVLVRTVGEGAAL